MICFKSSNFQWIPSKVDFITYLLGYNLIVFAILTHSEVQVTISTLHRVNVVRVLRCMDVV